MEFLDSRFLAIHPYQSLILAGKVVCILCSYRNAGWTTMVHQSAKEYCFCVRSCFPSNVLHILFVLLG